MMTPAQRRAIHPHKSVWVTASAGSGKTKVLTDRLLALLMAGNAPNHLLCLTFTKAAAAEMANRLHRRLSQWAVLPEEALIEELSAFKEGGVVTTAEKIRARQLFSLLLETPGGFKIQTLHSFCQSLLRRFPLEAGLAPHFTVLDERSARELLKKAQDHLLYRIHQGQTPELADAFQHLTGTLQEMRLIELMQEAMAQRTHLRALLAHHGSVEVAVQALGQLLGVGGKAKQSLLQFPLSLRGDAAEEALQESSLVPLLRTGNASDQEKAVFLQKWVKEPRPFLYPHYRRIFVTEEGSPRKRIVSAALLKAHPNLEQQLKHLQDAVLAFEEKQKTLQLFQNSQAFLTFLSALQKEYECLKEQRGVLDYEDLISKTLALLTHRSGSTAWVLYKLDGGIDHILVDEAQDTSQDQWRVIQALCAEFFTNSSQASPKTLFVVGDPKQSIYRFQGADPLSFEKMQTAFRTYVQQHQGAWCDVALEVSFRSVPSILQAVDQTFLSPAVREGVSSTPLKHLPCPHKEQLPGLVEIWPVVPLPEKKPPTPWEVPLTVDLCPSPQAILAEGIAVAIQEWLQQGERLHGLQRSLRAGDILILVRRRNRFVETLVRFLKEKKIPVAGVDRLLFLEHLAIMDLVQLGECLLLPQDDLTLATVLKGPLVGLSEEALFSLAYNRGSSSLWSRLRQQAPESYDFLTLLREKSCRLSPYAFYQELLGPLQGRQKIMGRLGLEAQEPLEELLNLALSYEQTHPPSLQGFLAWLSRSEVEIKRDFEHHVRNEVRIMTVHGSKGLQAPVVILPDTCQPPRTGPSFFWHRDKKGVPYFLWGGTRASDTPLTKCLKEAENTLQDEEYRRLLYVAMTRAEERLYLCGWQTSQSIPEKSWFSIVSNALKRHTQQETFSFSLPFSRTWTGEGLRLKTETPPTPLVAEAIVERETEQVPCLPPWIGQTAPLDALPLPVLAPSALLQEKKENFSSLAAHKGTLLHRLLQVLPQIPPNQRADAIQRALATPHFSPEERESRFIQFMRLLEDPQLSFLFEPTGHAEIALVGRIGNQLMRGQIDRLIVAETEIKIIDFKTNPLIPQPSEPLFKAYLAQLSAYQAMVQPLYPNKKIACGLLWISHGVLQWVLETHPPLQWEDISAASAVAKTYRG